MVRVRQPVGATMPARSRDMRFESVFTLLTERCSRTRGHEPSPASNTRIRSYAVDNSSNSI